MQNERPIMDAGDTAAPRNSMSDLSKGWRSVIRLIERVLWALGMRHVAGYRAAGLDYARRLLARFTITRDSLYSKTH